MAGRVCLWWLAWFSIGKLLLAEPPLHVSAKTFAREMAIAEEVGFRLIDRPRVRWCKAGLFEK